MLSAFARRVARTIRLRRLWGPHDRVIVALSGGADSVALTFALVELAAHAHWHLAGLVHVNHGLRGLESDQDETFCHALAARLALPIEVTRADVTGRRRERNGSLEVAAREVRYAAFHGAARALDATVVATAHTQDDQAETVLLRLLRGASTRGTSAIRPRIDIFARPLLELRREDVSRYLADRAELHREDSSNRDMSIPRNRLRHTIVPVIDAEWPGGVSALARFADLSIEDEAYLGRVAARARSRLVQRAPSGVQLERGRLRGLPRAIGRRLVRNLIEDTGGRPSMAHVEAVLRLVRSGKQKGRVDVAGLGVEVSPDIVRFAAAPARPELEPRLFSYRLDVPGALRLAETGDLIEASVTHGDRGLLTQAGPAAAVLQADRVALPLTVRSRQPGDRLKPLGAPGSKKVQDLLVDRKVPCRERDLVPIIEDAEGRILWVAGVTMAELARVTRPEAGVVILKIKKGQA